MFAWGHGARGSRFGSGVGCRSGGVAEFTGAAVGTVGFGALVRRGIGGGGRVRMVVAARRGRRGLNRRHGRQRFDGYAWNVHGVRYGRRCAGRRRTFRR